MTTARLESNDVAKALIDGALAAFRSNKGLADKAVVQLPDDKLQVLQKHLPERANRFRVLIHVERHEENQLLLDDIVNRKQILIRSGDDGQFVV